MLSTIKNEENWNQATNPHCTVKPLKLMEYLLRLVTPPNGTALDPFMGSGSTGVACRNLEINFIGIDKEHDYVEIANRRIQQGSECEEEDENVEKPHCHETETIEQTRLF
jgi:site-specific DNA-methyltransferase (adenine-specific)